MCVLSYSDAELEERTVKCIWNRTQPLHPIQFLPYGLKNFFKLQWLLHSWNELNEF